MEALELALSTAVAASCRGTHQVRNLLFMDISKAYLRAEAMDDALLVELKEEIGLPGYCEVLRRAL